MVLIKCTLPHGHVWQVNLSCFYLNDKLPTVIGQIFQLNKSGEASMYMFTETDKSTWLWVSHLSHAVSLL